MTPDMNDIEKQEENPAFLCSVCSAPIVLHDGNYFRECDHIDAPIIANMAAVVYGKSKVV